MSSCALWGLRCEIQYSKAIATLTTYHNTLRKPQLIGHTHTKTGLNIQAALDTNAYPTGKKADTEALAALNIERSEDQNSQGNYIIRPHVNTEGSNVVG